MKRVMDFRIGRHRACALIAGLFTFPGASADEVNDFKSFVQSPAPVVEAILKDVYPMGLRGRTPVYYYQLTLQSNAWFLRKEASYEGEDWRTALAPLDGCDHREIQVGCWNQHGWMIACVDSNTVALRINDDLNTLTNRNQSHQVAVNVTMVHREIRNLLRLGLHPPQGTSLRWEGLRFTSTTNASGECMKGTLSVHEGRVVRADFQRWKKERRRRTVAVLYSYMPAGYTSDDGPLPSGIPDWFTVIVNPDTSSNLLSSVTRILQLKFPNDLLGPDRFSPERHLGGVKVRRYREVLGGVEALTAPEQWERLVGGEYYDRQRARQQVRYLYWGITAVMVLLGAIVMWQQYYRQEKQTHAQHEKEE